MNKVFVLKPSEDWIVDRFVKEWYEDNPDISVANPLDSNVIWLFSDWCWKQIPYLLLREKKVITTIHHIVPEKFNSSEIADFSLRDQLTTVYHVPNKHTHDFIKEFTKKPIHVIPYWANQKVWRKTFSKLELRKKYGLQQDSYVVGSFQRDTEGNDLKSPKLEKGPDLLADYLELESKRRKNLHVVLAGWRRQYIMKRLDEAKIAYSYFERPSHEIVNELYQTLDLYPVTSRHEGGPQSLIECGLLQVPVISRDVGMSRQVLPDTAIRDKVIDAQPYIPNVESWKLPHGYQRYRDLISTI